jgi:hypothetical protein
MVERYDVHLLGFEETGERTPAQALGCAFGLSPEAAGRIVEHLPRVVKTGLTRPDAQRYVRILEQIGARVQVRQTPIKPQMTIAVGSLDPEPSGDAVGTDLLPSLRPGPPPSAPVEVRPIGGSGRAQPESPQPPASVTTQADFRLPDDR